jgi:hypothetical protein
MDITNTYNIRYFSTENLHLVHKILYHDAKVGVWYALHARTIWGLVFYADVIKYEKYIRKLLHVDQ